MEKLLLVDGHSILNRAFYGLPDLTNSEGLHTGAVYGFLNILFRIIEEEKPEYLTVAFDVHAPTFRHEMYAAYKGTRKPMPEELRGQVPLIKEVLSAMGICMAEKAGLEADDILGTLAYKGEAEGMDVTLLSGDRDLLQIATEKIKIRIPKTSKGKTEVFDYHAEDVLKEWQLTPKAFIELKALMGDTADNIPGVPKVGQKTATELMVTYGSLDNIYAHLDEITKKSIHDSLAENKELAYLSLKLATICTSCDLDLTFEDMRYRDPYTPDAYQMFRRLGFKNLLGRFDKAAAETSAAPKSEVPDLFITVSRSKEEITEGFLLFLEKKDLGIRILKDDAKNLSALCLVADTTAFFVCPEDDAAKEACEDGLVNLFEGKERVFTTFDAKDLYPHLQDPGADVTARIFDTHIAAYLINPLKDDHVPEDVILEYAGETLPTYAEAFGKKRISEVLSGDLTEPALYFCNQTAALIRCKEALLSKLRETDQERLFAEVEMPLSLVLSHMEREGVMIAPEELTVYGRELGERILVLEKKIHESAGEAFNINSPKQLGEILFEKMQIPGGKKTKTGYSTAADVLEKLAPEHPIVADILEYRGLSKLKSTYADALITYVEEDQRIRSSFHQTVTATGRLSSSDPNLQNIPMRTEMGKRIRKVFIARPGFTLVDADYSQIELRVLASMSGDQELIKAYREDADIHRMTAAKVFGVAPDEVTPLMRRNAKAVNFGIVYGISSFGLSQDLSISKKEAAEYIESYFKMFPDIKAFLEKAVSDAKEKGYTVSLFGRRRPMPELQSSNFMTRSFGERVAKNAPIQGTAADIIKIAMIRVDERLRREGLKSRLILQIHDELLVETAKDEVDIVRNILREEMSGAADLAVPLEIGMEMGDNWYEAH